MAKETTKTVSWKEVVDLVSSDSGIPKKQIEDTAQAIDKGIKSTLSSKQPKRDGDSIEIETPFTCFKSTRLAASVVVDQNGNKVNRPTCCAVNTAVPVSYIDAANLGLVDTDASGAATKASKSA